MPRLTNKAELCAMPNCGKPATDGRWCSRENTRRKRLGLPADVDGAELGEKWAAVAKRGRPPGVAPRVAPVPLPAESLANDQATARNLDVALAELREVLDMDGYSPAAIVQRAAMQLRLAKTGVPSDVLREIVMRCGLPATTTSEQLVEYVEKETAGRIAEQENARRLCAESIVKVDNTRRQLELVEVELAHHLGLDHPTVRAWGEAGGGRHLTNLKEAAQHDANVELRTANAGLLSELAFQTELDESDVEKWLRESGVDHLENLHVNRLERRRAKAEQELNEALDEAGEEQAGLTSLAAKCAKLEAENDNLVKVLGTQAFVTASPPPPLPSTVDITLPGGLRVLIQPVGGSS